VFVAIDHISDMIREVNTAGGVRIFGLADSGYFLKYDSLYRSTGMTFTNGSHQYVGYVDLNSKKYAEEIDITTFRNTYATKMKAIYKMMNLKSGLPLSCILELDKEDSGECIFAENLMKYIKTPTFLLQPVYDSWQLKVIIFTCIPFHLIGIIVNFPLVMTTFIFISLFTFLIFFIHFFSFLQHIARIG
jgi:hypothetical protein